MSAPPALWAVEVTVRLMVVARDEHQAEALGRSHARDELMQGVGDVVAYECRDMGDVGDDWKRALPYGDAENKTCQWWLKKKVGLVG